MLHPELVDPGATVGRIGRFERLAQELCSSELVALQVPGSHLCDCGSKPWLGMVSTFKGDYGGFIKARTHTHTHIYIYIYMHMDVKNRYLYLLFLISTYVRPPSFGLYWQLGRCLGEDEIFARTRKTNLICSRCFPLVFQHLFRIHPATKLGSFAMHATHFHP